MGPGNPKRIFDLRAHFPPNLAGARGQGHEDALLVMEHIATHVSRQSRAFHTATVYILSAHLPKRLHDNRPRKTYLLHPRSKDKTCEPLRSVSPKTHLRGYLSRESLTKGRSLLPA